MDKFHSVRSPRIKAQSCNSDQLATTEVQGPPCVTNLLGEQSQDAENTPNWNMHWAKHGEVWGAAAPSLQACLWERAALRHCPAGLSGKPHRHGEASSWLLSSSPWAEVVSWSRKCLFPTRPRTCRWPVLNPERPPAIVRLCNTYEDTITCGFPGLRKLHVKDEMQIYT